MCCKPHWFATDGSLGPWTFEISSQNHTSGCNEYPCENHYNTMSFDQFCLTVVSSRTDMERKGFCTIQNHNLRQWIVRVIAMLFQFIWKANDHVMTGIRVFSHSKNQAVQYQRLDSKVSIVIKVLRHSVSLYQLMRNWIRWTDKIRRHCLCLGFQRWKLHLALNQQALEERDHEDWCVCCHRQYRWTVGDRWTHGFDPK